MEELVAATTARRRLQTGIVIAFALIMGVITTGLISFAVILWNLGFREGFVHFWIRSWGFGYMLVIPALLIVAPKLQRLVDKAFRQTAP